MMPPFAPDREGPMSADPGNPPRPPRRFPLFFPVLRGCLAGLIAAAAMEVLYIFLGANVHVVADGAVYRSAQLGPDDLERVVRRYHIRTVVNLCGCCDPTPWYVQESKDTSRLGVCQEDVGFSASRLPSAQAVLQLIDVLDHSDYPVLIHCHRGIDRTGLASAVALLLHTDATPGEARRQLGLRFCHMNAGKYGSVDRFFDLYERWLAATGRAHEPAIFREWVEHDYCPGECREAIALLDPPAGPLHAAAARPFGFRVRCTNKSPESWVMQPGSGAGVHLGWVLLGEDGSPVKEGRSGLFDATVPPDGHIDLTVALPPLVRGRYQVQLDMIDEQQAWFYQSGGADPAALDLEVE